MKIPEFIKRIFGFLGIATALLLCWSAAYWLASKVYAASSYQPSIFVSQLITSLVGFVLFGFFIFFITKIPWVRAKQEKHLNSMIHAMKMMAEGNFDIDLSYYRERFDVNNDHPYSKIIRNISHMAEKLGEMEGMRQEFISNVSHEIQSPLTSISGFAYTLKNGDLTTEERNQYLDIIEKESLRLSKLSDNLLKLTSLESDQLMLEWKHYRLDHQLRRVILANEPHWAEKRINMDVELDAITLEADRDLMDQVWVNLIHNSIKFTPQDGTIAVHASTTEDGRIVVTVKDNGVGMNQDTRLHMFERFYKADKARNREHGGSGLGLSIVKRIIDLHEAEIEVDSELGKGTEITVTFTSGGL
ncbi:HAMP domain-containing sensor histidine kinase [Halobacillus rhizosphaerae]|uniref:sensor histidine kinase n=1 Tax=Halobacillus rhizosphaerae TaxID=3064889 RepID=UPI00398ADA59